MASTNKTAATTQNGPIFSSSWLEPFKRRPYATAAAVTTLALAYPVFHFVFEWRSDAKRRLEDLRVRTVDLAEGALPLTRMVRVKETDHGNERLWKMRESSSSVRRAASALDLREGFRNRSGGGGVGPPDTLPIGLMSLGDYLSSLRPAPGLARTIRDKVAGGDAEDSDAAAKRVQEEVDAILAAALIRVLGARLGTAALPVLGKLPSISKGLTSAAMKSDRLKGDDAASVSGALISSIPTAIDLESGISLLVLGAATDSIATVYKEAAKFKRKKKENHRSTNDTTMGSEDAESEGDDAKPPIGLDVPDALTAMRQGEIKSLTRSFIIPESAIPNPFIMEEHWDMAVEQMIDLQRKEWSRKGQGDDYDPDSYPVNEPKPLNENLLPDLYLGFGGARGTHTHREIIRGRIAAVLLNRLGANDAAGTVPKFVVSMKVGKKRRDITRPDVFLKTLMELGHDVEACFRLNVVSFGVGLCVKEEEVDSETDSETKSDGGERGKASRTRWTNIPIGVILRSGYEDESGRPAYAVLTHGGLDLDMTGPLLGGRVSLQHYHAIDGFCGWFSNQRVNVPWLTEKIELGQPFRGTDAIRAARVAGLTALALNTTASKFDLLFGGYGVMGVCLDSAAVVEQTLRGETSIYPMLSIGRFSMHVLREARNLKTRLQRDSSVEKEVKDDMSAIVNAMLRVPNDIASSPSGAGDAARRMLCCTPASKPFQIMVESEDVLKHIISEHEKP